MKATSSSPLSQAFASAQAHADVWNRPPPAWRPRRRWLSRPVLLAAAVIAAGVAVTIAIVVGRPGGVTAAPSAPAFPSDRVTVIAPEGAPAEEASHSAGAFERRDESSGSAASPVDTRVTQIERHGSTLNVVLRKSPLAEAVQALAQATHAQVHGTENLGSQAATVTLHWRGSSAASAWRALLAGVANTAVTCKESRCQIWFVAGPSREEGRAPPGGLDGRAGDQFRLPQYGLRAQQSTGAPPVVVDKPSSPPDAPAEGEPSG